MGGSFASLTSPGNRQHPLAREATTNVSDTRASPAAVGVADLAASASKKEHIYLEASTEVDGSQPSDAGLSSHNTNGLWEVEHQDPSDGSRVMWGKPIRLRHINTH